MGSEAGWYTKLRHVPESDTRRDPKRIVPNEHARRITYPSELTFGILVPASSYSRPWASSPATDNREGPGEGPRA